MTVMVLSNFGRNPSAEDQARTSQNRIDAGEFQEATHQQRLERQQQQNGRGDVLGYNSETLPFVSGANSPSAQTINDNSSYSDYVPEQVRQQQNQQLQAFIDIESHFNHLPQHLQPQHVYSQAGDQAASTTRHFLQQDQHVKNENIAGNDLQSLQQFQNNINLNIGEGLRSNLSLKQDNAISNMIHNHQRQLMQPLGAGDLLQSIPSMMHAGINVGGIAPLASMAQVPKCVVIPCRARAMPKSHNAMSANFTVNSSAVSHGDELICSYDSCRNCGVKFLWCETCEGPVPKRNFKNRHSHNRSDMPTSTTTSNNDDKSGSKKSSSPVPQNSPPTSDTSASFTAMNSGKESVRASSPSLSSQLHAFLASKTMPEGEQEILKSTEADCALPQHTDPNAPTLNVNDAQKDIDSALIDVIEGSERKKRRRIESEKDCLETNMIASRSRSNDGSSFPSESKIMEECVQDTHGQPQASSNEKNENRTPDKKVLDGDVIEHSIDEPMPDQKAPCEKSRDELDITDNKRTNLWENLLHSRPTDASGSDMSKWLLDVIAISDKAKPVDSISTDHA